MTVNIFVYAVAMLLVIDFAALFGAHMFDTSVNVPVFFADPPNSIRAWMDMPVGKKVPGFFARFFVFSLVLTVPAIAACVVAQSPLALVVATACLVIYLGLIFLFFLPVNRKLGFLPPVAGASPPDAATIKIFTRRWRAVNRVRSAVHFIGLVAAANAVAWPGL